MRRPWAFLLALCLAGTVSCADFPAEPPVSVPWSGRILDRTGVPMGGVSVQITPTSDPNSYYPSVQTDPQGVFSTSLIEGSYRVEIYPPYRSGYPSRGLGVFEIRKDSAPLEYQYLGTLVSGTVTGPGGAALPSTYVAAYSSSSNASYITGQTGEYELVLPAGAYSFSTGIPFGPTEIPRRWFAATISPNDTTIDFDLGGHEINYIVTLNGSTPLIGANVAAQAEGIQGSNQTGPDGRARLYLPDGTYHVLVGVGAEGFTSSEELIHTVSGPADVPIDLVRVQWNITLRWTGSGETIPFMRVSARELNGSWSAGATTDHLGRAPFLVRPQRTYQVVVYTGFPNTSTTWEASIDAGADSTFDLLVPPPPTPAPSP